MNRKGFTLVETMIVVAIIGLLAAAAIPNFVKAREITRKTLCINNLRLIDHAKEQWAIDNNKNIDDTVESGLGVGDGETVVGGYMRAGFPVCPSAGAYTIGVVGTNPTCGYGSGHEL